MAGVVIRDKFSSITQREDMIEFIFFLSGSEVENLMNMKSGDWWENLEFFSSEKISNYFGFVYEVYDWKETEEMEKFCRRPGDGVEIYQMESDNDSYNLFYVTEKESLFKEIFDMINMPYGIFDQDTIHDFADKEDPDEDEEYDEEDEV